MYQELDRSLRQTWQSMPLPVKGGILFIVLFEVVFFIISMISRIVKDGIILKSIIDICIGINIAIIRI